MQCFWRLDEGKLTSVSLTFLDEFQIMDLSCTFHLQANSSERYSLTSPRSAMLYSRQLYLRQQMLFTHLDQSLTPPTIKLEGINLQMGTVDGATVANFSQNPGP